MHLTNWRAFSLSLYFLGRSLTLPVMYISSFPLMESERLFPMEKTDREGPRGVYDMNSIPCIDNHEY